MSLKLPINDRLKDRIETILKAFEKTVLNQKSLEGMADKSNAKPNVISDAKTETRSTSLDAKTGTGSDAKSRTPYDGADGFFMVSEKDEKLYTEDINLG